ncbi:MAG: RNA polymerase sigma factor [Salinivirgaceae bacterium]|jgi:RNA polymerase sigma factor (sigma-70 family)|nr:RNA polymerase sigma factor [Salinivirgaceae bacterium]
MKECDLQTVLYQYKDQLYRFAFSIVKNEQDAQDVLQDVMVKMWTNRDHIAITTGWKSYLMQAVRNKCLDYIKRHSRTNETSLTEELQFIDENDLSYQQDVEEELAFVEQIIEKLPERERSILYLKEYEMMDYEQIAGITRLSVANIRTIISRTRKTIKQELQAKTECAKSV